jgi:hypothetical protein
MALCALPLLCVESANAAPPKHATSTVTRTGAGGNSATKNSNMSTNGAGGYTAGSTVTGPAGNQASHQQSGAYNAATQTYTRSGGTTGPLGNSTSSSTSAQKTATGYQRSAVHTGAAGNSVTTTGQASYNAATGTATQSRSVKGPNGNGPTESRSVTVTPPATTTSSTPSN